MLLKRGFRSLCDLYEHRWFLNLWPVDPDDPQVCATTINYCQYTWPLIIYKYVCGITAVPLVGGFTRVCLVWISSSSFATTDFFLFPGSEVHFLLRLRFCFSSALSIKGGQICNSTNSFLCLPVAQKLSLGRATTSNTSANAERYLLSASDFHGIFQNYFASYSSESHMVLQILGKYFNIKWIFDS